MLKIVKNLIRKERDGEAILGDKIPSEKTQKHGYHRGLVQCDEKRRVTGEKFGKLGVSHLARPMNGMQAALTRVHWLSIFLTKNIHIIKNADKQNLFLEIVI